MSKQTNAFQKLIHHIHTKIENTDTKVTESAFLLEKNIDEPVEREIDVLIEKEVNGTRAKIAVESRDRAAKDDIEWVDGLIGKYKNLDVHKVIAVSNSGFSRAANLKAKANGIELKTIDEAFQINFGEEFVKLGATYISHIFNLKTVSISFNPPLKKKPTPNSLVYQNARVMGDLEGLAQFCYEEGTKKKLVPYYKQNFLNIFNTRADVEKQMLIEHTIPINELYIESDGEKFYVTSITFMLIGTPTTQDIDVKHRTYEGALITEAIFDIKQMDNIHTAWIAQLPKNKEAKVFVKSKPRRKKK
jgi:hypothetical protein